jgi:hypothetical protein
MILSDENFGDLAYILDFLDHLRGGGIRGDIVQIKEPARSPLANLNGLHFAVRSIDDLIPSWPGPLTLLDHELARGLLAYMAGHRVQLFLTLETTGRFHSFILAPELDERATRLRHALHTDRDISLLVFLGHHALLPVPPEPAMARGRIVSTSYTLDSLWVLTLGLPSASTLALLEFMSHPRALASFPSALTGRLEIHRKFSRALARPALDSEINELEKRLAPVLSESSERARALWRILPRYLAARQFESLRRKYNAGCEGDLEGGFAPFN